MPNDTQLAASDILTMLAPPIKFVVWIETIFEAKRRKGEAIPEAYTAWLERWRRIRSDLPAATDVLTDEEWQALKEMAV